MYFSFLHQPPDRYTPPSIDQEDGGEGQAQGDKEGQAEGDKEEDKEKDKEEGQAQGEDAEEYFASGLFDPESTLHQVNSP